MKKPCFFFTCLVLYLLGPSFEITATYVETFTVAHESVPFLHFSFGFLHSELACVMQPLLFFGISNLLKFHSSYILLFHTFLIL